MLQETVRKQNDCSVCIAKSIAGLAAGRPHYPFRFAMLLRSCNVNS